MRQISVSQFTTCQWTFEEDLLRYQALGYDSIGIWRRKIDDFGHRDAIDMLYDSSLSVSSLSWAGGFTGSDGRSFVEAIEDAMEAITLASKLDAKTLIVHPGARNNHTNSHAFRLLESALVQLTPVAEDYGVKLSMELVPGFVEPEQLGLVLDFYHAGLNQPTLDRLDLFADRIDLVQLSDRINAPNCEENRVLPGQGSVNLAQWVATLDALNYDGPIEVELHGAGVEGVDYFDRLDLSYDFLRHELPQPVQQAARHALPTAQLRFPE